MTMNAIERWRAIAASGDIAALDGLLAADVVFRSPVVHTPQVGREAAAKYLRAAIEVLNRGDFHYVEEWLGPASAVLEFEVTIDAVTINGIDIIHWNEAGEIVSFKVMARPLKAINLLQQLMARALGLA